MRRDEPILRELGQRARERRLELDLDQEALAQRSGFKRSYISKVENGHRNVAIINIVRLAEALEMDPADLLTELDELVDDEM